MNIPLAGNQGFQDPEGPEMTETIIVRCTPEQKAMFTANAGQMAMKLSAFIRYRAGLPAGMPMALNLQAGYGDGFKRGAEMIRSMARRLEVGPEDGNETWTEEMILDGHILATQFDELAKREDLNTQLVAELKPVT